MTLGHHSVRNFSVSLAAGVALAALTATAANAQNVSQKAETADDAGAGDIIVTATRDSTLLSKTPITMTAVTGETLRNAGITDARSLASVVPGLQISENDDAARISIRGVSSTDNTEKGDPSASFLVDGVYIARPADVLGSFYDIERIEVLRGPQGTLYGRNTTAGVINVISAKPKDAFAASLEGTYGNLGTVDVTGMVNVGLGNGVGVRAAVNYQRQDSYRIVASPSANSPINPYRDALAARLSFGGKIGNDFTFYIKGDYLNTKGTGVFGNPVTLDRFYTNIGVPTVDPIYVAHDADFQRTLTLAPTFPNLRNNKSYGVTGEFTYDFGPVQLTYLGGYRKTDRNDVRNLLLFGAFNNPAFFFGKFKQDSHEVRLAFGKGSPLHGQVGGYYFHEESFLELNLGAPLSGFVVPGASGFAFPQGPTIARSKAAFGQITYDITPELHITGGVRYTQDFKSRDGRTVVDFSTQTALTASGLPAAICTGLRCTLNQNVAAKTYNKTIFKGGIDYDVPGLGLIYASVSTGYKAGGFNDGCVTGSGIGCNLTTAALYYDPETLTSYEVGVKLRIASNFRLTAAAFHYDYSNLQVSQIVTVPIPATLTRNAASAKVDGFEIESQFQPSANDRFEVGYTYTNARYSTFLVSAGGLTRSFAGLPLDHAPKHVVSVGYTHSFPLGEMGRFDIGVRTKLSSEYFMQDLNNASLFRQPSFTKTDLTATFTTNDDRFFVQGFIKNIENTITIAAASTGIGSLAVIEQPRTFGVRAGVKF